MNDENVQENILARLNRIEGQVRGIRKMVEEQRNCTEVLRQVAATDAALRSAAKIMVAHHLDTCFSESLETDEKRKNVFAELLEMFGRF